MNGCRTHVLNNYTNCHQIFNEVEMKFCEGIICSYNNPLNGTWRELEHFGHYEKSYDKLRAECKDCKNFQTNIVRELKPVHSRLTPEQLAENKQKTAESLRPPIIDGKKECTTCHTWKLINVFSKKGTYYDGTIRYTSMCNDCLNKSRRLKNSKAIKSTIQETEEDE